MRKNYKNNMRGWSSLFKDKRGESAPKKNDKSFPKPPKSPPSEIDRFIPPPPKNKSPSSERRIPSPSKRKPIL